MRILLFAAAAMFCASCVTSQPREELLLEPAPFNNRTPLTQAEINETCEASGVSQQRDTYVDIVDEHMNNLRQPTWSNLSGQVVPDPNVLLSKLRRFRVEVDGAYRLAVGQCKTHLRCLEANDYDERMCVISGRDRSDAERRFTDLSRDFADIDRQVVQLVANVARTQAVARGKSSASGKRNSVDCESKRNFLNLSCIGLTQK